MSKLAKERGTGGVTKESYQAFKHGWYKDIYCGSSWQLAFVIYMTDQGKIVKRCQQILYYEFNGKLLKYYPDFEIDGVMYQIKGYQDEKAKVKHLKFPQVVYYNKQLMKPILKYVKQRYGKDFTKLFQQKL